MVQNGKKIIFINTFRITQRPQGNITNVQEV